MQQNWFSSIKGTISKIQELRILFPRMLSVVSTRKWASDIKMSTITWGLRYISIKHTKHK